MTAWFILEGCCRDTLAADLKYALGVGKTSGVEPHRNIDNDRREEACPEIS
ncbi:MAG: hypothetical protein OXG15_01805 [Gammaproteobacteria bacterium]|nr:hypothetical protein [Gammaproteobacteria bacterium]